VSPPGGLSPLSLMKGPTRTHFVRIQLKSYPNFRFETHPAVRAEPAPPDRAEADGRIFERLRLKRVVEIAPI
jgi:hypothetical protein